MELVAITVSSCPTCERCFVISTGPCPGCGGDTIPVDGADRGQLVSWTTVEGQAPYLLGWAQLDNANVGVMGRFSGPEGVPVRSGLPVRVRQSTDQPWPRILFTPDTQR